MAAIGKRVRLLNEWSQVRILPIDSKQFLKLGIAVPSVNRLVAGSSPARGANQIRGLEDKTLTL
jgi:hypothetical protein